MAGTPDLASRYLPLALALKEMEHIKQTEVHSIVTPIGVLEFLASVQHGDLHNAQIKTCRIEPILPEGMSVEGCIAVLFEFKTLISCQKFIFRCKWRGLKEKGYECTGEALDAWEWEKDGKLVIVGTEDNECLSQRVSFIDLASTVESYPIAMQDNCIEVRVGHIPSDKKLSLHYIVAWNSLPEVTESSCWFAVDVPHEQVVLTCE